MSTDSPEQLGRLDDETEAEEQASPEDGAAAQGEYDPRQGSPGTAHPVGESYPEEAARDDETGPRRTDQ